MSVITYLFKYVFKHSPFAKIAFQNLTHNISKTEEKELESTVLNSLDHRLSNARSVAKKIIERRCALSRDEILRYTLTR